MPVLFDSGRDGWTAAISDAARAFRPSFLTVPATLIALSAPAFADWTGSSSTDWFNADNWDSGVPADADVVTIGTSSPNDTIISGEAATVDVLDIEGTGSLTIESGGSLAATTGVELGSDSGSTASLIVTGSSSTLELASRATIIVGEEGDATLTVAEGGAITGDDSFGLTLSDYSLLVIGGQTTAVAPGTVTLAITFDGEAGEILFNHTATETDGYAFTPSITAPNATINVTSGYTTLSGDLSGIAGTITIEGGTLAVSNQLGTIDANDEFRTTTLVVGDTGTDAALAVVDGGNVLITEDSTIGNQTGSSGTVTVTGSGDDGVSTLSYGGDLDVGNAGTGALLIEDGGLVAITGDASVGSQTGSSGTVTVTGSDGDDASTLSVDGTLYVGEDGSGTLVVAAGGGVTANDGTGTIEVAKSSDSTGVIAFGAMSGDAAAAAPGTILAGAIKLGSGTGSVVFNHTASESDPFELSVPIDGDGTIDVLSGYTEFLGDKSSFSGALTVDGGNLAITTDFDGNTLTVGNTVTGGLQVENEADAKFSGAVIIGNQQNITGTVIVSGFSQDDDDVVRSTLWSKSLIVGEYGDATLQVGSGAEVDVDSGNSELLIADKEVSTGTLAIGAAVGESPVGPGIVKASHITFGDGSGFLRFNHDDDTGAFAFDHKVTGAGTIVSENGYTSLTGTLTDFTGTTEVDGGSLSVDTTLPGAMTVSGGTLLGTGTLSGHATIKDGGTIAPGNSVGTLSTADVTFDSGSVYAVEIDSDGKSDLIKSSGTVKISDGSTVDVTSDGYDFNRTFTIITADELQGQFNSNVTGGTTFIGYTLAYTGSSGDESVELTQTINQSFSDVASTKNEQAVAGALDPLVSTNVTHEAIQGLLGRTSEAEARELFNQLTGEGQPSLKSALIEGGQQVVGIVDDRFTVAFGRDRSGGGPVMAYSGPADVVPGGRGGDVWIAPYGNWLNSGRTGNTSATDSATGGIVAGAEAWINDNALVGVLGGYGRTTSSIDDSGFNGTTDAATIGIYGGYEAGAARLSAGALYAWDRIDTTRQLIAPLDQTLEADYGARSWQLFAEASYAFDVARATVTPFAGVSYINLHTDAFKETGGSAALSAEAGTTETTFTTIGLRSLLPLGDTIRARGMWGWRHAFGDVDPATVFALAASEAFTILGSPIAEDALVVETGIDYQLSDTVALGAFYQGQYGGGSQASGFTIRLGANF